MRGENLPLLALLAAAFILPAIGAVAVAPDLDEREHSAGVQASEAGVPGSAQALQAAPAGEVGVGAGTNAGAGTGTARGLVADVVFGEAGGACDGITTGASLGVTGDVGESTGVAPDTGAGVGTTGVAVATFGFAAVVVEFPETPPNRELTTGGMSLMMRVMVEHSRTFSYLETVAAGVVVPTVNLEFRF